MKTRSEWWSGLAVAFAAVFAQVGCSAPVTEEEGADAQEGAIRGGEEDASRASSVAQLYIEQQYRDGSRGGNHYCTGAVIAPDAVLTAARCFAFTRWAWQQQRDFETHGVARLGPEMDLAEMVTAPANVSQVRILIPRGLDDASGDEVLDGSLAVVRLGRPLADAEPLEIGRAASKGAPVTLWGYGCTEKRGKDYGVLRSRSTRWGAWEGIFGTSFSCETGDDGAVVLDARGDLVGISPSKDAVVAIDEELRRAIQRTLEDIGAR